MTAPEQPRVLAMTGATGFVGSATLQRAVTAGWQVRALTRRPQEPRDGVTWIDGALDRLDSLAAMIAGADAVLHIAGVVNVPTRAAFEAGNAIATANVVAAARDAGVARFVHVSSLAARADAVQLWLVEGTRRSRGDGERARLDHHPAARRLRPRRHRHARPVPHGGPRHRIAPRRGGCRQSMSTNWRACCWR